MQMPPSSFTQSSKIARCDSFIQNFDIFVFLGLTYPVTILTVQLPCWWDLEYADCILCRGLWRSKNEGIFGKALNFIWLPGSRSGDLGCVSKRLTAVTLAWSGYRHWSRSQELIEKCRCTLGKSPLITAVSHTCNPRLLRASPTCYRMGVLVV